MITTHQRLNVSNLKDKIKEEFRYAPYQQDIFHNKRVLEEEELLTELSMEQKGDLIIKVMVSITGTFKVCVKSSLQFENYQPLQFNLKC